MTALFVCNWCGEFLRFDPDRGWVHLDGALVRTRRMTPAEISRFERAHGREPRPAELYIDDHAATPVPLFDEEGPR